MTPWHPDLKRIATVSGFLSITFYGIASLIFDTPIYKAGLIIGLVGCFWLYFEQFGWRQRIFRLGGWLCDVPDLNGRWVGTVDREGENRPHLFVQEIKQTFSRIKLYAYSENSRGESIVTQFAYDHLKTYSLISTWRSRTKNRTDPDKHDEFYGTSIFTIAENGDGRCLKAHYFTSRDPQTKGESELKLVGRELRHDL